MVLLLNSTVTCNHQSGMTREPSYTVIIGPCLCCLLYDFICRGIPQVLLCLLFAAFVCALWYGFTAPEVVSVWYAVKVAALCAVSLTIARSWLLERQYKVGLLLPTLQALSLFSLFQLSTLLLVLWKPAAHCVLSTPS